MKPRLSVPHNSCSHGPGRGISHIHCRLEGSFGYEFAFFSEGLKAGMILLWETICEFLEFSVIQEVLFSQQCLIIGYPEL